jgi:hypothetical protein
VHRYMCMCIGTCSRSSSSSLSANPPPSVSCTCAFPPFAASLLRSILASSCSLLRSALLRFMVTFVSFVGMHGLKELPTPRRPIVQPPPSPVERGSSPVHKRMRMRIGMGEKPHWCDVALTSPHGCMCIGCMCIGACA